MRFPPLLVFAAVILSILGVAVGATTVSGPAQADTSKNYNIGYEASITYNGSQSIIASVNASTGSGPRVGAVESYNDLGNASQIVVPPPQTVTNTTTVTKTYTYTVTRTITGPNGETTVVTQIRTVTIPQEKHYDGRILYGAGILVFLFLLLLAKR